MTDTRSSSGCATALADRLAAPAMNKTRYEERLLNGNERDLIVEALREFARTPAPGGQAEAHPSIAWLAAEISEKASLMMQGTTSYLQHIIKCADWIQDRLASSPTQTGDVIAAIDPFTRGAFTGWKGKSGDSKITLDEAEDHFSLCMADMMDAARAAALSQAQAGGGAQSVPEPFDVMATIYPDYAESFERETCPLCDHIDGTTTPPAQADVREAIPGAEALAARLREAAYFCTDLARLEEHCRAVADELDCAALQPQAGNAAVSSTNHSGEA